MYTDWKFVKKSYAPDVINQLNLFNIDAYKNNLSQASSYCSVRNRKINIIHLRNKISFFEVHWDMNCSWSRDQIL